MTISSDSAHRIEAGFWGMWAAVPSPADPAAACLAAIVGTTTLMLVFAALGGARFAAVVLAAGVALTAGAVDRTPPGAAYAASAECPPHVIVLMVALMSVNFRLIFKTAMAAGCDAETASRFAGGFHAFFAAACAAKALWRGTASAVVIDSAAFSLGYLAHDLELVAWGALRHASTGERLPVDWSTVAHHLAFGAAVAFIAPNVPVLTARALLAEAVVLPLYLGWWLVRSGGDRRSPRLFAANAALVIIGFVALRVINFAEMLPDAVATGGAVGLLTGGTLLALNVYWTWRLVVRAWKSLMHSTPVLDPDTPVLNPVSVPNEPVRRRLRASAD